MNAKQFALENGCEEEASAFETDMKELNRS